MNKLNKIARYNLSDLKRAFNCIENLNMTFTAMQGQYDLEFSDQDVVNAIQDLKKEGFYKTMQPKHTNFTAWQDVYKSTFKATKLYIKFQADNRGEIILSFKKR